MPSTIFSISFGIISALLLGIGMCLAMGELGGGDTKSFIIGVIIGIFGIICASINYPIYKKLLARGKEKYAFEIVTLAKEISESK